jgi:hypothetical protein
MDRCSIRRGSITKAGNGRVRHLPVESAWTYRHAPRIGKAELYKMERVPPKIREIAWKAKTRLRARCRAMITRGKKTTVVRMAIARELGSNSPDPTLLRGFHSVRLISSYLRGLIGQNPTVARVVQNGSI